MIGLSIDSIRCHHKKLRSDPFSVGRPVAIAVHLSCKATIRRGPDNPKPLSLGALAPKPPLGNDPLPPAPLR
ncbi:MAG: hypothetical protein AAGA75_03395 [Cyanobacteria bacterium P01_E01_bin.6]